MQKIKIAKFETGTTKNNDTIYTVTDDAGAKFSGFGTAPDCKQGDTIEAEVEVKGKYNNLKSVKVVERGAGAEPQRKPETPDARNSSIEAQSAAHDITTLWAAGKFQDTDIEVRKLRAYLRSKLNIEPIALILPAPTPEVKAATQTAVDKADKKPEIKPEEDLFAETDALLKQLRENMVKAGYKEESALGFWKNTYKVSFPAGLNLEGAWIVLSKEQQKAFCKKISDMLPKE
jgi:hypothetical protein